MKKMSKTLPVCISLAGIFFIVLYVFSYYRKFEDSKMPDIPANLNAQSAPLTTTVIRPVPILMYHHIQIFPGSKNASDGDIFVSPGNFESDLQWLAAHNYQTVGLDYFTAPAELSKKPVVLTFDDGYEDAYTTAFPLLKKYGFTGTFYLITNNIDASGFLTKNQVLEMHTSGMVFGSHTLSHPNLTTTTEQQAGEEIYGSKIILERKIHIPVSDFSYPGGTFDRGIETIVQNSGYATATTTISGTNKGILDPLMLTRLYIKNDTEFDTVPELDSL